MRYSPQGVLYDIEENTRPAGLGGAEWEDTSHLVLEEILTELRAIRVLLESK